jgi:hypothetical protein
MLSSTFSHSRLTISSFLTSQEREQTEFSSGIGKGLRLSSREEKNSGQTWSFSGSPYRFHQSGSEFPDRSLSIRIPIDEDFWFGFGTGELFSFGAEKLQFRILTGKFHCKDREKILDL